jgi:hypothetical protein
MEPKNKSNNAAPKKKWTNAEFDMFMKLVPRFGNKYIEYLPYLNRSYACIKGFYHNLKRENLLPIVETQRSK